MLVESNFEIGGYVLKDLFIKRLLEIIYVIVRYY